MNQAEAICEAVGIPNHQKERPVTQLKGSHRICPLTLISAGLPIVSIACAGDMVSFATGGYARGPRSVAEMPKIDTDGDGNVSKAEWLAYQEEIFAALWSTRENF